MFDRKLDNFRKEWLKYKHKKTDRKLARKNLLKINEQIKKGKSFNLIERIESLIYLSKFKQANIVIDNFFCDIHPFDKNFKSCYCDEISKEELPEIFFYRGFVKTQLKDYKDALQEYDKANQLGYILRDISFNRDKVCYEIEITNKKLYGFVEGNKKNKEYFSNILKNHPDDFYALKYLARANYFIDVETALKNYKTLFKDSVKETVFSLYFEEKKRVTIFWILAIIKCNIKIWKTKKINKSKEILKYLKKADTIINSDENEVCFFKKEAEIFLNYYKYLFYKMTNEQQKANKYITIEKNKYQRKIFLQRCYLYPARKLDKVIKSKVLSEEDCKLGFVEVFCNHNISFKCFKTIYDKLNVKMTSEYIEKLLRSIEDYKEEEKRLKYIIDKSCIDIQQKNSVLFRHNKSGNKKFSSLLDIAKEEKLSKNFIKYLQKK